jgi:hypothetical protein
LEEHGEQYKEGSGVKKTLFNIHFLRTIAGNYDQSGDDIGYICFSPIKRGSRKAVKLVSDERQTKVTDTVDTWTG